MHCAVTATSTNRSIRRRGNCRKASGLALGSSIAFGVSARTYASLAWSARARSDVITCSARCHCRLQEAPCTLSGGDESHHLQPSSEALIAAQAVPLRRDCEVDEGPIVQSEGPIQMFEWLRKPRARRRNDEMACRACRGVDVGRDYFTAATVVGLPLMVTYGIHEPRS